MVDKSTAKRARDEGVDMQVDRPAKRIVYVRPIICQPTFEKANRSSSNIDDFNNMITVLVGREEEQFILYQDVVCAKSKFFKAACSKKWREGREKVVRLPEFQPDNFKTYCDWLFSGQCPEPICTKDSQTDQKCSEIRQLIDIHLLGETLDDIQLRNHSIATIFQSMRNQNTIPHASHLTIIWNATPPRSQLRKMLVHAVVTRLSHETFADLVTQYSHELVQDVAVTFMRAKSLLVPWEKTAERLSEFQEVEESG